MDYSKFVEVNKQEDCFEVINDDYAVPMNFEHFIKEDYEYIVNNNIVNHKFIVYYPNGMDKQEEVQTIYGDNRKTSFGCYNIDYYLLNKMFPVDNEYDLNILFKVIDYGNLFNLYKLLFVDKIYDKQVSPYNDISQYNDIIVKRFILPTKRSNSFLKAFNDNVLTPLFEKVKKQTDELNEKQPLPIGKRVANEEMLKDPVYDYLINLIETIYKQYQDNNIQIYDVCPYLYQNIFKCCDELGMVSLVNERLIKVLNIIMDYVLTLDQHSIISIVISHLQDKEPNKYYISDNHLTFDEINRKSAYKNNIIEELIDMFYNYIDDKELISKMDKIKELFYNNQPFDIGYYETVYKMNKDKTPSNDIEISKNTNLIEIMDKLSIPQSRCKDWTISPTNIHNEKIFNAVYDRPFTETIKPHIDLVYNLISGAENMFKNNEEESIVKLIDLSDIETNHLIKCSHMFYNQRMLEQIIVNKDKQFTNILDGSYMFSGCSELKSLEPSYFDKSFNNLLFATCMFTGCTKLYNLDFIKDFTFLNVIDTSSMFTLCNSLTSIDFHKALMNNVINSSSMFSSCWYATDIGLSRASFKNTEKAAQMFSRCYRIKDIKLNNSTFEKATDVSGMFYECNKLETLKLESATFEKVVNASDMFYNCSSLTTLILPKATFKYVNNAKDMFKGCKELTTIYMPNAIFSYINNKENMFEDCDKLRYIFIDEYGYLNLSKFGILDITKWVYDRDLKLAKKVM